MKALKTLFIATALLGSAAGVQAADNFVGLTWGETSNNIQKSKSLNRNLNSPNLDKVIDNTGTWGIRAGQQFEQGRYYATYENSPTPAAATSCASRTCSAATTPSCRSATTTPSCSAVPPSAWSSWNRTARASSATAMSATLPGCRPVSCRS